MRTSLNDKAYRQLKRWIVRHQLRPGQQLKVAGLAEALGMSRTPVREALSRLEQENLVKREPMKGFTVTSLDPQEISDLHEVREAVEVMACRQAALRMRPRSLAMLKQSLDTTAELIAGNAKNGLLNREQDFHLLILEGSGNRQLAEVGQSVLNRIWNVQRLVILTSDLLAESHRQHLEIYQALISNDPALAGALMQKHMAFAAKALMRRLNDHNDVIFQNLSPHLDLDD